MEKQYEFANPPQKTNIQIDCQKVLICMNYCKVCYSCNRNKALIHKSKYGDRFRKHP